jgi:hypothetical protein
MKCDHCGPLFFPDRESLEFHMNTCHEESIYSEPRTDFGYFVFSEDSQQ